MSITTHSSLAVYPCGDLWGFMRFYEVLWGFMGFYGALWGFRVFLGVDVCQPRNLLYQNGAKFDNTRDSVYDISSDAIFF